MRGEWTRPDVLIVGAGPSGSTLATLMARRGWTVVVVDRERAPRPKACGEFLSPGSLQAMRRLDLPLPDAERGRVTGWTLHADGIDVTTSFPSGAPGASLPRDRLDGGLVAHARKEGANVLEGFTYVCGTPGRDTPGADDTEVRIRSGAKDHTFRPTVLVGAGGLRCPVSRILGRGRPGTAPRKLSLTGHVRGLSCDPSLGRLFVRGDLTVGLAPSDGGGRTWNSTVVVPVRRGVELKAVGARRFFFDCLCRAGIPFEQGPHVEEVELLASSGFRHAPGTSFMGRTVLIGDAQGYFDPFTGQGIYQALRSAELLAPMLHLALAGRVPWSRALGGYDRRLARERRGTHRLQQAVEAWLTGGRLRPPLSRALARAPRLFGAIMEATTDRSSLSRAIWDQVRAPGPVGEDFPTYPGSLERKAGTL